MDAMTSLYASVTPQFTRDLLSPGLRVGYTDEGGVWQFLAPSLLQRLPLRGIEWRNLVGVTKRIDQLPLHFVEISVQNVQNELPLTCLYLVKCEDLDTYKSQVRPSLTVWVDAMTAAKVEWLVLYVPLGTRPKAAGNAPNPVYKKIFDRLRADFVLKKAHSSSLGAAIGPLASSFLVQDKVCKIDTLEGTSFFGQQQQHEAQWTDLLVRLRHCIMDAFQTKCFQYEENLRLLDTNRGTAGWDFGAFFLAKEQLALMYQQMYLHDDAIRHLDELDAIFVNLNETEKQTFQDQSKRTFERHDPIFTQSPLTLNLESIQQCIASNGASTRLISLYCFCRQLRTLYVMGTFPQLLERASSFIESFFSDLRAQDALEWHQPFLWAVGACMEIAYACELAWSGKEALPVPMTAIGVEEMSRALGNVLYLARRILKSFAKTQRIVCPNKSPIFSMSTYPNNEHTQVKKTAATTWYRQLERVFQPAATTWERYDRCVSELSHVASMHFSQSGRHRFAVFLGGECAAYYLAQGDFESASRLLRSLARQSQEDGWWTIFATCMRQLCRAELAIGRATQAVAACLRLLPLTEKKERESVTTSEMKTLLSALSTTLTSPKTTKEQAFDLSFLFQPTIRIETLQTSEKDVEKGAIRVIVSLTNEFAADIHLEHVCVRFSRAFEVDSEREPTDFSLEKRNVHLDEHSNVKRLYFHAHVPRGRYLCRGIDCVLAGLTLPLISSQTQALPCFDIATNEKTVHVGIRGAPLLMPQPVAQVETITIRIQANEDMLVDGMLQVRVNKWNENHSEIPEEQDGKDNEEEEEEEEGEEDDGGIQLIGIQVLGASTSSLHVNTSKTLLRLPLPPVCRHETLECLVSLAIAPFDRSFEGINDDIGRFHLHARVWSDREETSSSRARLITRTIRTAAESFRVLDPLSANVQQLQRVGTKLYTSIQFVCNPFVAVVLVDYKLRCPDRVNEASMVMVETDPNTSLRGTKIHPNDVFSLAFTLATAPAFENVRGSTCELEVALRYGETNEETWEKTMNVPIALDPVEGPVYRLHVCPKRDEDDQNQVVTLKDQVDTRQATTDPITFEIHVQEEGQHFIQASAPAMDQTMFLCFSLDENSAQDWLLVGKDNEQVVWALDSVLREFKTEKRLVPTRTGRIRFPTFRLLVNGHEIPRARVHSRQTSRHLSVT